MARVCHDDDESLMIGDRVGRNGRVPSSSSSSSGGGSRWRLYEAALENVE